MLPPQHQQQQHAEIDTSKMDSAQQQQRSRRNGAAQTNGHKDDETASEEDYFALNPAPAALSEHLATAKDFIQRHLATSRPVALITSGGTTVPLENQTVRFIDNFSAGTRGAASAEYFLRNGYAVLFLHREFSLLPFARHYSHSRNCFLDLLTSPEDEEENGDDDPEEATATALSGRHPISIKQEFMPNMHKVLRDYNACKKQGTLLQIPFVTITEYLWLLRETAKLMQPLGARGLFYLAAAVSDFFVPAQRMVNHKIQSGSEWQSESKEDDRTAARVQDSRLVIDLDPVPKFLRSLVDSWAPEGMIVSFKLETDPSILTSKAASALKKYSHHLVIGNLLKTRRWEVVFVYNAGEVGFLEDVSQDEKRSNGAGEIGEKWIRVPRLCRVVSAGGSQRLVGTAEQGRSESHSARSENEVDGEVHDEGEPTMEIESLIIPEIKRLHQAFVEKQDEKH